jgi:hypothetical protein
MSHEANIWYTQYILIKYGKNTYYEFHNESNHSSVYDLNSITQKVLLLTPFQMWAIDCMVLTSQNTLLSMWTPIPKRSLEVCTAHPSCSIVLSMKYKIFSYFYKPRDLGSIPLSSPVSGKGQVTLSLISSYSWKLRNHGGTLHFLGPTSPTYCLDQISSFLQNQPNQPLPQEILVNVYLNTL